ncbi:hypothetical protein RRG08_011127 [Elysia crispata]|uniref:Uncharacterized protein n=1 Tax=Elysia crispata TaxID=231223 RepID=A0AAE1DQK2_9GAST|nr:hypothetical protein RRG08_011127 [Elysia crispata]
MDTTGDNALSADDSGCRPCCPYAAGASSAHCQAALSGTSLGLIDDPNPIRHSAAMLHRAGAASQRKIAPDFLAFVGRKTPTYFALETRQELSTTASEGLLMFSFGNNLREIK